ncbi:MAG TPA: plastocyanin/azurin family copper-binding protein [Ktedonobacterales bacterium]|nr:plastocyanin/azurin family copper-binding protein [Ktedonobacterales bacterium]
MKKVALLALFALAISALAACGGSTSTPPASSPTNTPTSSANTNTITMGANTFSTTSISITKGSTITFTNEPNSGTEHILVIGDKGAPATEAGAPDFGGAAGTTIQAGASFTTGAWNTDGTFHVTCIIHPTTMNLTITVTG